MEMLFQIASAVLLIAGCFFCLVGGLGILRLPDFYTRLHAASITDTLGAWLILIGLALQMEVELGTVARVEITAKLAVIGVFMFITSPVSGHALARAAWSRGLEPKLAKPGEGRDSA